QRLRRAVAGDLVVLHSLRGGDQGCVAGGTVAGGGDDLFALADQPFHAFAMLLRDGLPYVLEDLVETRHVPLRLLELGLEGRLQPSPGASRRRWPCRSSCSCDGSP